jgi:hypothetical protein
MAYRLPLAERLVRFANINRKTDKQQTAQARKRPKKRAVRAIRLSTKSEFCEQPLNPDTV